MRTVVLFLFFILLSGCSLNRLYVPGEINKVTVVEYTPYMKHHRAYFTRTELETINEDQKYLYLYDKKNKYLGFLLHRKNEYILYNLSKPEQAALTLHTDPKTNYTHILKRLKRQGFTPVDSLYSVGVIASVAPRRYKGVKTLLVEVQDYSHLQELYKDAIRRYHADGIESIQTKLPKQLIYEYYRRYEKRARTRKQLAQLQIIAQKLQIKTQEEIYTYYLYEAPLDTLSAYLSQKETRGALSNHQYSMLKRRKKSLQEEKLFNEGSLEDLIAAYKINKDPNYKKRILLLIKEKQENK
ncbi:hypothetical protein MN086_10050 [Sulfurovum sp. XGS-02]|uniref:hypothetical protein n=1 Tax=Sulfurovum sp. XGS-02 TaxID=2925411 RepID=UPI00207137A3|nr:hypothetical protein [Sulfurovum sp. XGS-02]UPT77383.1 hypothetical protein MN086_10050 [Sulfurovum sp. XGS-02]